MHKFKSLAKRFLNKYIYQDWNIAIADISSDLSPVNIKWMEHSYRDRWFADPFIIGDTGQHYIILVEECMHSTGRGRLARLTVTKSDCRLINNETILDLPTHLSFPNPIMIDDATYIYPENAQAGNTKYYSYGKTLKVCGFLSDIGLADAVIARHENSYYLLATRGKDCNGNSLDVYRSSLPFSGYRQIQQVKFADNIARRAGNVFEWQGILVSPAQVCDNDYGEGVSLQKLDFINGEIALTEIKRMSPPTKDYPEGFHTYNVFGDKVVIDGYRYGSKLLHKLYFKFRGR